MRIRQSDIGGLTTIYIVTRGIANMSKNDVTNKNDIVTHGISNTDQMGVTKRGRARKYRSDAEKQRAYRERRTAEESKRIKQITGHAVFIDPNKAIDTLILNAISLFDDGGSWIRDRTNWRHDPDKARIPEWISSLQETRKNLNRVIRQLKKL